MTIKEFRMALDKNSNEFAKNHFDKLVVAVLLIFIVVVLVYAASMNLSDTLQEKLGNVLIGLAGLLGGLMGAQTLAARQTSLTRAGDLGPGDTLHTETSTQVKQSVEVKAEDTKTEVK